MAVDKNEEACAVNASHENQRDQVSQKIEKMIQLATTAMNKGKFIEFNTEPIAHCVKSELFDQITEAFPSVKMEYDDGKIFIIEIQGIGHQAVIHVISKQFGYFSDALLGNTFEGGGGLTPTYVYEDGFYRTTDKKADPDEALSVFQNERFVFRVIFEIEIHNRNFVQLDKRMKSLLGGWPDCFIGIACKYLPRKVDDGDFEGVVLVYYNKAKDIGTAEISTAHLNSLPEIKESMEIEIPTSEERCTILRIEDEPDGLETSNPEFYCIELDSDLLYRGTKFQDIEDERPLLVLDFLEITRRLHRVEGKAFSR